MKGVFVIICNLKSKKILVEKETFARGGKYKLVGGTIENDENTETALSREIKEEIGLDIFDSKFFYDLNLDGHNFSFYYKIYEDFENDLGFYSFNKFKNPDTDVECYEFISIEHFLENAKYESYKFALKEFLKLKIVS